MNKNLKFTRQEYEILIKFEELFNLINDESQKLDEIFNPAYLLDKSKDKILNYFSSDVSKDKIINFFGDYVYSVITKQEKEFREYHRTNKDCIFCREARVYQYYNNLAQELTNLIKNDVKYNICFFNYIKEEIQGFNVFQLTVDEQNNFKVEKLNIFDAFLAKLHDLVVVAPCAKIELDGAIEALNRKLIDSNNTINDYLKEHKLDNNTKNRDFAIDTLKIEPRPDVLLTRVNELEGDAKGFMK